MPQGKGTYGSKKGRPPKKKTDLVIAIGTAPHKMNMGGMMPTNQKRKVNPTTGLSMNKGGMTDYRKSGMFYGGMARKR